MARQRAPVPVTMIGDNFMLPEKFIESLNRLDGLDFAIRQHTQNWPDEDMTHGYDPAGQGETLDHTELAGLKEYFGTPDDVIPLIAGAEIFIGHLAPITQSVIDAAPDLKLIGISRGGPVNIDLAATRRRGIQVVNTPGRNAGAVAEFTPLNSERNGNAVDTEFWRYWSAPGAARRGYLLGPDANHFRSAGYWPLTAPPTFSQHGGDVPAGFQLVRATAAQSVA